MRNSSRLILSCAISIDANPKIQTTAMFEASLQSQRVMTFYLYVCVRRCFYPRRKGNSDVGYETNVNDMMRRTATWLIERFSRGIKKLFDEIIITTALRRPLPEINSKRQGKRSGSDVSFQVSVISTVSNRIVFEASPLYFSFDRHTFPSCKFIVKEKTKSTR